MKKVALTVCLIFALVFTQARPSFAFDFGASAALLLKLLAQSIEQLAQLRGILQQGKDTLRILEDVNRNIEDSIRLLETFEDTLDPGTLRELRLNIEQIIDKVELIYGQVPDTPRKESQILHDQTIVDAIARHNQIYEDHEKMKEQRQWFTQELERRPGPGRSVQISADIQYEILKALTRIEKNQALSLKLLAETLGLSNEIEKKKSEEAQYQYESISNAIGQLEFNMALPSLK